MTVIARRTGFCMAADTRWVLLASILASGMVFIDGTALSVALPAMQAALGATGADLLWLTNGFSVPLAALLLLGGSLGDYFGRKRVFLFGIVVFAGASMACGLAPDIPLLLLARVVQGIGGALMIPGSLAMVSTYYGPTERGRAIGTWSAFSVVATALGPVLGGLLARAGLWRWVFFINLPLAAIATTVLVLRIPPDASAEERRALDWTGAVLVSLGLAAVNYALIQTSKGSPTDSGVLSILIAGILALILFFWTESRARAPLLPLDLFRSRTLTVASLLSVVFFMAFHGMLFFLPLNLIQVQGYDPALAGLTQLPLMVLLILLSRFSGSLVDRFGPRVPLTLGPAIAGVGFWLFSWPGITQGPREFASTFLPGLLLVGAGLGLTAAPLSTTVMSSVHSARLGLASGINSSLSRLAGVLAIAVLGPIAIVNFAHDLDVRLNSIAVSSTIRSQIQLEAAKLVEARIPAEVPSESALRIKTAIKGSFVDTFGFIAKLTGVLSWLAAALALAFPPRPEVGV